MASDPDDELIARVAAGDRDAFTALYRRHRAPVYRFALHMCGARATAEDVVQEVFVAVMHDALRYRPGVSNVAAWLLGIARNHVRRLHARAPALPLPDDRDAAGPEWSIAFDPVADLARQRRVAAVRRALAHLPVKYREVVALCDLQELSYADAAKVLRCAIGTVRSRLHRARARLERSLSESEADEVRRVAPVRVTS